MEIVSVTFHSRYNRRGGENKDGLNLRRIEKVLLITHPEQDWGIIQKVNG